jgi:hypothetical protein
MYSFNSPKLFILKTAVYPRKTRKTRNKLVRYINLAIHPLGIDIYTTRHPGRESEARVGRDPNASLGISCWYFSTCTIRLAILRSVLNIMMILFKPVIPASMPE